MSRPKSRQLVTVTFELEVDIKPNLAVRHKFVFGFVFLGCQEP